ncbi:hypothetical protein SPI_02155 [Niveomyces insectorum RCEF 264]|uniref:DUF8021 domain-containing protein n=1 Tax=Niveomyces insectorum RCEF 264 TaxID=1081102 RepID=A0A162KAV1_9HYPO|nr:hypothetical protein SPI_02155 [Niveomyces insectorum RCEF 264]
MVHSASLALLWLATAVTGRTVPHRRDAACPRSFLQNITSQYVAAQSGGKRATLQTLASNVTYIENDITVDVTKAVLNQPMKIDHNRSFHDTTQCAALTEIIVTDPKAPYVIHTRFLADAATRKVTTVDSLVTKPGDWAFNATGYLYWDSLENWDPIPADKRDSRAVIKAAGDAYFDRFDNASVVVPMGTPCARLEGGAYTGRGNLTANTCDIGGFPDNIKVTNRRYIIDEVEGVVDIFEGFPGLDRSVPTTPAPDSHLFRVENGKLRYIHTVSHCINAGCGMNGTLFGR